MILIVAAFLQDGHPWSGWKEGTSVTLRTTTVWGREKTVKEETITVLRADSNSCTVRIDVTDGKQKTSREETHHFGGGGQDWGPEKGRQDVTVDGTKFTCTVHEQIDSGLGGKSIRTTWIAKGAPTPGGIVKQDYEGSVGNNNLKSSYRLLKLKDSVRVKAKPVTCWVVEVTESDLAQKSTTKMWGSPEIPGHLVKKEIRVETGGAPSTATTELVTFEAKR